MDIFAHGMWAGAAAIAAKRKLARPVHPGWAALCGVFPDLVAFTPSFALGLWFWLFRGLAASGRFFFLSPVLRDALPGFLRPDALYHYSHSLVIFSAVFGFAWWLRGRPVLAMMGWSLHILMDIPTHRAGRYGTPFAWPLTDYRFDGISWGQQWFMILNWSAIAVVCLILLTSRIVVARR
jgi:hypothetical protein